MGRWRIEKFWEHFTFLPPDWVHWYTVSSKEEAQVKLAQLTLKDGGQYRIVKEE